MIVVNVITRLMFGKKDAINTRFNTGNKDRSKRTTIKEAMEVMEKKLMGSEVNRGTRIEIGCNTKIQIACFKYVALNDTTRQ